MARITVEDCLERIDNRFELVLVATKRARQLASGSQPHLAWENDKPTVMALREIADGLVDHSVLDEVTAREHGSEPGVPEDEIREALGPTPEEEEGKAEQTGEAGASGEPQEGETSGPSDEAE